MADVRDEVQVLLKRHQELVTERGPREALWRECERWVDPEQQGGFFRRQPGGQRDGHITENSAQMGLEAFVAAMDAMLTPEGEQVTLLKTSDSALNDAPAMQRWLQHASDRLHACRNAAHTGFQSANTLRWRMLGLYGWAGMWIDEWVGRGLFYQTPHPSELFIDNDFRGRIDTVHRRREVKARQLAQMFHDDQLPPKVKQALADNKPDTAFTLVHVIRPNSAHEPGRLDIRRFPIQSIYMLEETRDLIQVGGYYSHPLPVSRYILSPYDAYGVGPSGKVIGTIRQLNIMAKDTIKAFHLGMQPPILMPADGTINRMNMTPGAPIPGGMDNGKPQIAPFNSGVNPTYSDKAIEKAVNTVNMAFLVHVFAIMQEPIDRQTATEYLGRKREAMLLQAPNVSRQIGEALVPQCERELDILMRAGQIAPPPPELREAGAGVMIECDNPLTRAARSADAHNFMGALEMLTPMAQLDPSIFDVIDTDAAPRGVMQAMGVRADWLLDPDQVAAKRQDKAEQQQGASLVEAAPAATQAMLNMAKARQLAMGGGA